MERKPNKSQHKKLTLEKKIYSPLLPRLELTTFRSRIWRSTNKLSRLPLLSRPFSICVATETLPPTHPPNHSFTQALTLRTYSVNHSPNIFSHSVIPQTHLLTHSLILSFPRLIHSLTHTLTHSLTHSLITHSPTHSLTSHPSIHQPTPTHK